MFESSVQSARLVQRQLRTPQVLWLAIWAVIAAPAYLLFQTKDLSGYDPIVRDALATIGFFCLWMFGDVCYFKFDGAGFLRSLKICSLTSVTIFILLVAIGFLTGK